MLRLLFFKGFSGFVLAVIWLRPASGLELVIQADAVKPGAPRTFSVLLVNRSDHPVYVPLPTRNCGDGYDGWVRIYRSFKTLRGRASSEPPTADCEMDRGGPWPSILERIKGSLPIKEAGWKILNAGGLLTLTDPRWIAFQNDSKAGTYEFWATYGPPSILDSDRQLLSRERLDIPEKELMSNHLFLVKRK